MEGFFLHMHRVVEEARGQIETFFLHILSSWKWKDKEDWEKLGIDQNKEMRKFEIEEGKKRKSIKREEKTFGSQVFFFFFPFFVWHVLNSLLFLSLQWISVFSDFIIKMRKILIGKRDFQIKKGTFNWYMYKDFDLYESRVK